MAEKEEELLILEDDEEELDQEEIDQESHQENSSEPKKSSSSLYIVIVIAILILLLVAIASYFILSNDDTEIEPKKEANATEIIKNIKKVDTKPLENSRLAKLTKKAKELYNSGKKEEALKIYKEISLFHKSLASFNLGVAYLKEKKYNEAIKKFDEAFVLDDLKFESSLNKAICYLKLSDKDNFSKELKKADEFVISKYNSPLFNYYLSLLEYYKDAPFESLAILRQYNSSFYDKKKNLILSKEYAYIKNFDYATESLAKMKDDEYLFTMGLMYAKLGKYSLAKKSFINSINNNKHPLKSRVALALVQNKLGLFEECSSNLKTINSKYADKASNIFPIKVMIKRSLYDPVEAQKEFKNSIFNDKLNRYGLIFYFAPYKLYDPKQSNTIIEKGAKEIYINNLASASSYLNQASSISEINLEIIEGLKLLQMHKVYEANKIFQSMIDKYPNHSVLHYNLALTYANIGYFKLANKHFDKSYILDKNNSLALFFKAYTAILQNRDYDDKELESIMKYSPKEKQEELMLLYKIIKDDSAINLKNNTSSNPFDMVLNIIGANLVGDENHYTKYAKKLKETLPRDIVANIIYIDQLNQGKNIKEYAKAVQNSLAGTNLDLSPLLYGELFARELYVNILNIAGITYILKSRLENELPTNQNQIALKQSLAYTYIFTKEYEKAYKLYNDLIDNQNIKDPHTLFLASVASLGAKHQANAIALLELANLEDRSQYESRYALGLLYQEAKNFEGAAIQYARIGNSGFKSKYFDFDLKH